MIDDYLIAFVSGFKHRKHRAGRSRQTKSGAEAIETAQPRSMVALIEASR